MQKPVQNHSTCSFLLKAFDLNTEMQTQKEDNQIRTDHHIISIHSEKGNLWQIDEGMRLFHIVI
jgi:hypothetical protein